MLDDAKSTAGLCRLCIRRCLEDDPVDTPALGDLYRRLLVSASSRVSKRGSRPPSEAGRTNANSLEYLGRVVYDVCSSTNARLKPRPPVS